jgi:hypothetical protein
VPVTPFTTVSALADQALPARVLFLPFASGAYRSCFPLTGFCADPDGGVMVLPAENFEIVWTELDRRLAAFQGGDLSPLTAVGTAPDDGDAASLAIPVVRADGSLASVGRAIDRGGRGRAELVAAPTRATAGGRPLLPEAEGPELEDAPPPPSGPPFEQPTIVASDDLTGAVPVLVAVRGSTLVVYAIEPVSGWSLNHDVIPLLGGGALPHLASAADGTVGLAVPVPRGLVVPIAAVEPDGGGFDIATLAVPLAVVLAALTTVLGMMRVVPVLGRWRRSRKCQCIVEHNWLGSEIAVSWVGPTDVGRTHAARPFPLAAAATGFHVVNVTSRCEHRCGEVAGAPSARRFAIVGRNEISWQILAGGGGFVAIEDTLGNQMAVGDQVLFQPPALEIGEEREVRMRVEASHADPGHPGEGRSDSVDVAVVLRRIAVSVLEVEVTPPPSRRLTAPDAMEAAGECAVTVGWKGGRLAGAIDALPADSFVTVGDHVRLHAGAAGTSDLILSADGNDHCAAVAETLTIEDAARYEWSATAGTFPAGNIGAGIVFQAPDAPGEVTVTVTISPAPGEADKDPVVAAIQIEVCALGVGAFPSPATWLPDARNGRVSVTARTYRNQGGRWIAPGRRRAITFRLTGVSSERGVCMNYPPRATATGNPDLFFAEDDNAALVLDDDGTVDDLCPPAILAENDNPSHHFHYQTARGREPVTEATAIVRCEDYGAFGRLEVEAADCAALTTDDVSSDGTLGQVTIPRDDNGNSIADGAPHDGAGAADDDDSRPVGDGAPGDGLTNYEEYRGFMVGGGTEGRRHVRTDVTTKDIFVHDEHNLGVGHFAATGLTVHILRDPDLYDGHDSRVVNFNRGHASGGDQHGVRLVRETLAGPRQVAVGGPGTPAQVERVAVDTAAILAEGIDGMGDRARAHGLAHAVGVSHHGEPTKHLDCGPHTESAGGETSGDVNCVMRYTDFAAGWCHDGHHRHEHPVPDTVGTSFCTAAAGTGPNDAGGHRNDAARGDCAGQVRVKDW